MNSSTAPIALFAYNRPIHLRRTVDALAANGGAADSELIVFSDGARTPDAAAAVAAVRAWLPQICGFRSVRVVERTENWGLARSITTGVAELVASRGRVIVLEDDMVTSPHFLRYMNEALDLYADVPEVVSIHGYFYPDSDPLPETFFLRGADCWGWATWERGWKVFESDGARLLAELERRGLCDDFDFGGAAGYTAMLRNQIAGLNDSWAVRWYAAAFLAGGLTLYPGRSLVHNIGNDGSGRHAPDTDGFGVALADDPIRLAPIPLVESAAGRRAAEQFFRRDLRRPWWRRLGRKLRRLV